MSSIRDKNEGISFWEAAIYFVWYYLIVSGILIEILLLIIKNIVHVQSNTITSAWIDEFGNLVGSIAAIGLMLMSFKKYGLKELSVKGKTNIYWFIFIILFFSGYVFFRGNTIDLVTDQIPVPKFIEEGFDSIMSNNYLMFFSTALVAPIIEETICRGIILELFLRRYKDVSAVVLSALLFGLIHMNIPQFINAFIMGLVLGYIYLKTKSLIACMFGHFCNNFIICVVVAMRPELFGKFNALQLAIGIALIVLSVITIRKNVNADNKINIGGVV